MYKTGQYLRGKIGNVMIIGMSHDPLSGTVYCLKVVTDFMVEDSHTGINWAQGDVYLNQQRLSRTEKGLDDLYRPMPLMTVLFEFKPQMMDGQSIEEWPWRIIETPYGIEVESMSDSEWYRYPDVFESIGAAKRYIDKQVDMSQQQMNEMRAGCQ